MSKTITFFGDDFDGKTFNVPEKLNIKKKFEALLWLYDQMDSRYLSTYEGEDPYKWFNQANSDARQAVYEHLKKAYIEEQK
jgi:hypothetical protein